MCNRVFLNWGCFFELFLNDLDEKVTSADYERHKKENKETSPIITTVIIHSYSHAKRKYSLTLNNFSLTSQQMVPNYFLYSCKCPDVHLREI